MGVNRPLAENGNFKFIGLNSSETIYTVRFMPEHDDLTPKKNFMTYGFQNSAHLIMKFPCIEIMKKMSILGDNITES